MRLSIIAKHFSLRWLTYCVIMLVFAAVCICIEDINVFNDTGRYKKDAGSQINNTHHNKRSSNGLNITLCPGTETTHNTTCDKGQRFNATTGQCATCLGETYIPMDNHRCQECIECTNDASDHKVIKINPGNSTHQPEFGCEAYYYIERNKEKKYHCKIPECSKCTICASIKSTLQACSNTSNAKCCKEGMVVVSNKCTNGTTSAPIPGNVTMFCFSRCYRQ